MAGAILARAYLPKPEDIKTALKYADLGIKFQIILYELSSGLFWTSLSEVLLFIFAFLVFLPDASEMGGIFFHILHVGRGIFGIMIVRKLPNFSDLVSTLPQDANRVPFDKLANSMENGAQKLAIKFQEDVSGKLKLYVILSAVCIVLDFIQLMNGVTKYGTLDATAYAGVASIVIAFVFLALDYYFFLWALSVKMKLPVYAGSFVFKGLLGFISGLVDALKVKTGTTTAPPAAGPTGAQAQANKGKDNPKPAAAQNKGKR